MAGIYKYTVEQANVEGHGRAKISFINGIIMQTADTDAYRTGFGVSTMQQENYSWVLSRYAVQIDRIPTIGEVISVDTWIGKCEKFFSVRNFILRDESGATIGTAISLWALINLTTRRPMLIEEMHEGVSLDREEPMSRPAKIGAVRADLTAEHRVAYSDIDFNGHLNSMRSIDHLIDMLPVSEVIDSKGYRLDINFSREGFAEQVLTLTCQRDQTNLFDISVDGTSLTKASITLF
ncbi:MAG: acyl-ACP thioesterase [Rikenellaceae bacterium]|nr:acyl-ACP thioesterase [Rikenellaceae bacterium]